ncbi:MAG: Fe-S protein assembly chaperone HscA [Planctomycetota bacterium]
MTESATSESGVVLGIDLGTTNSLAAVMTPSGPKVLRDRDGQALVPSVVTFVETGELVGAEARAAAIDFPERTVYSIKRLIGRAGTEVDDEAGRLPYPVRRGERDLARVEIDGRQYSPEEISARVLRKVRSLAEAAVSAPIRGVVVTVPAYFDDAQRQATKDAAELAGLRCLRIVNEPTAASLAYGISGKRDGTVLVYDLGGGTFDVSVLKIEGGVFRVLATDGDTHLGGDDFDRLLSDRILGVLRERLGEETALAPHVMHAVRGSAEGLKIQLSSEPAASLAIEIAGASVELSVTRAELEADIEPLVQQTLDCCRRAMQDAELTFDQLDEVVLVGGSTRTPLVRSRIEELTGRPPHTEVDPDLAVALGAAIQADILAGGNREVLLLDVIPLSLGLETMGGVVSKLILRNSTIPTSVTEEFSTQVDHQTGVDINIYQGEREKIDDCRKLGSFRLSGIPPAPAGYPRVAVTFLVDADGVLRVTARETRTGQQASIQVVPSFGLTREEVRRMMMESIEHAAEDMAEREDVELRNKAEAMVRGTAAAMELGDLPPDQVYPVKKALRAVEKSLADDPASLRATVEQLSKATAHIADDVISSAVRKSLTESEE